MRNARFRRIVAELGLPRGAGAGELCAAVGDRLERPVLLRRADLPPDLPSGLVVETRTAFVIFLDALASPWLQDGIVCHEVAHLLLGHHLVPGVTRAFVPTIDPDSVVRALARTCYERSYEREAEALGTVLFARLNPWPEALPAARESAVIDRIARALGSE